MANAPTKAMRIVRDWNSSSMVGAIIISPGSAKPRSRMTLPTVAPRSGRMAKMLSAMVEKSIGHRNR